MHKQGILEVICGGMFSGKTEELIRRVRRAIYAKQMVQVFKPMIDDHYSSADVVSHSGQVIKSTPVETISELIQLVSPATAVVAIDEVQFFDPQTAGAINTLAQTYRVICAGLDMDYMGEPFGPMPELLARAELVTKVTSICVVCGAPGSRSQRLSDSSETIEVGAMGQYEPRCRACHTNPSSTIRSTLQR